MDFYDRKKQLLELSFVDESEPYEIDQAGIYFDSATGNFALITASGCSCWDGDYSEEQYASLDELEKALIIGDRQYNPSLAGARQLLAEARAAVQ